MTNKPTDHLRFGGEELVLRKKPPGKLLRGAHMIEREYQVMKALGTAGVPVPECLALCEDESVCGTPFYIMRYIHGRVFKNAALNEVPKEQRKEIYLGMVPSETVWNLNLRFIKDTQVTNFQIFGF